jgi:YD repeat-containing protein
MASSRRWIALALLPLSLLFFPSKPPSVPEVPVPGGVEVTPDAGGPLTPEANSGPHYANFWVKNTRTVTTTYNLACGTTGTANSCEVEPMQVTLDYNETTDLQVNYFTGTMGSGQVVLRATGAASDSGYYAVTSMGEGTPGIALVNHNGTNRDQGLCMVSGAGEAAGVGCGNLFVTHGMPAYRTMERDRSLALYYNSATATGLTLVAARVSQDPQTALPDKVRVVLTVGTAKDSAEFAGFGGGAVQQLVVGKGITGLATGRYPMTLEVRNVYGTTLKSASVNDTVLVVNRSSSGYGRGWSLLGVEELISVVGDSTRLVWVAGDGSIRSYTKPSLGSSVFRGAPGVRPDSLIRFDTTIVSTAYKWYRRNLPHGASVIFDQTGKHRATRNRVGAETRLVWKTVASQARLDSIVVPPDTGAIRAYRFFWNATTAVLDSIKDPIGRRLKSVITSGNLVSLTDPDSQITKFTYSSNLLIRRSYPRRGMLGDTASTTFAYAKGARLTAVAVQTDSLGTVFSTTALTPWDEKGLAVAYSNQLGAATTVIGLPSRVDGPISGTGDAADFWVNRFGAPTRITSVGLNTTTTVWYDSAGTPGLTTRVQYPHPTTAGAGGRIISLKWDAMGRLRETRDSTRHMGADSVPLKIRQWTYNDADAIQSPDSVRDYVSGTWRATRYSYDSLGLPVLITDWRNHQTTASYQPAGKFKGVILATVENQVQTYKEVVSDTTDSLVNLGQGFYYDINGNIREAVGPNGARTVFVADAAGRDSVIFNALGLKVEQRFDGMNRVRQTIRHTAAQSLPAKPAGAPPFMGDCVPEVSECGGGSGGGGGGGGGGSLPATLVTAQFHNAVGVDSVLDPRDVVRSYQYNARAAVHREKDDYGSIRKSYYSVAGMLDSTVARSGDVVRYRYDSYGRLASRAYSPKQYLSESPPSGGNATSTTTVYGDSISYTYNLAGQLLVAKKTNGTYQIIRTYYGDGTLRTKVTLGDVGGVDSLHYTYDQSGALIRQVHAKNSTTIDSTIYRRNATTGDVDSMRVYWGSPVNVMRLFTFKWDALGRSGPARSPAPGAKAPRVRTMGARPSNTTSWACSPGRATRTAQRIRCGMMRRATWSTGGRGTPTRLIAIMLTTCITG